MTNPVPHPDITLVPWNLMVSLDREVLNVCIVYVHSQYCNLILERFAELLCNGIFGPRLLSKPSCAPYVMCYHATLFGKLTIITPFQQIEPETLLLEKGNGHRRPRTAVNEGQGCNITEFQKFKDNCLSEKFKN